ncbi:hypothetical protein PC120_g28287 [Phytophthora cactorum]|nr:hypothetical protein PC120_g28287 [Phytophthora cactorum]
MLRTLSLTEQHGVALGFIVKEHRGAAAATTTTASSGTPPRVQSLKLDVSNYLGKEGEPLLRWLVEGRHCHCSSTHLRRSVEGCVRHVLSWRTSKELGVWTPAHRRYVLRHVRRVQGGAQTSV